MTVSKTGQSEDLRQRLQAKHDSTSAERPGQQTKKSRNRLRSQRTATKATRAVGSTMPLCPVPGCDDTFTDLRHHAFHRHVPETFDDRIDPKEVTCRRLSALKLVAVWLLGVRATVQDLARYISSMEILSAAMTRGITDRQTEAMDALCREMEVEPPENYLLQPMNSPAVLISWRAMLVVVAQLEHRHQQSLLEQFQYTPSSPLPGRSASPAAMEVRAEVPDAFDSHFHIDRTRFMLRKPKATFRELCEMVPVRKDDKVRLVGAVANFCDPKSYPSEEEMEQLHQEGVTVTVGLHPKGIEKTTEASFTVLKQLLRMPLVAGLGEVGLDHSVPPVKWAAQQDYLGQVLGLLEKRHVLVLHCRGMKNEDATEAYDSLLCQLRHRVEADQPIHLHCFNGNANVVGKWLEAFPRTYFGFTRLVESFDGQQLAGLKKVPEEQLLIETDAPYFQFRDVTGCGQSTPGLIGLAAKAIARRRSTPYSRFLQVTTANAKRLYGDKQTVPVTDEQ